MSIMIPEHISPEIKSAAEKRVFEWFKNAPGTENWIVLHSLGISRHQRVLHGEIDFLVIVPQMGMYALEVKGGRVERRLGKWRYINRYGEFSEKIRGPFDQAWEGIYSVKDSIENKLDKNHQHLKNILFGVGVLFPDIEYTATGADEEPWQVFDMNDGLDVRGFIKRLYAGFLANQKRLKFDAVLPSIADAHYISQLLRGDFVQDVPLCIKQKYSEEVFIALTKEQEECLEQLSDNLRTLIRGTAGTGKTLLAKEAAKRAVQKGEKVALFCYNRMLGEWLKGSFEDFPITDRPVFVGTFHSYMRNLLVSQGIAPEESRNDVSANKYFENVIPGLVARLCDDALPQFDRIIIDEAQDIIRDSYLEIINRSLKGGLRKGKWIMFGDFSMQSIYSTKLFSEAQFIDKIQDWASFTLFRLTKNCRNTKKICTDIENIVGIPENAAFDDAIDTPAVEHITYNGMDDQKDKLVHIIYELLTKHINPQDIVILSPRKRSDSVVNRLSGIAVADYSVKETGTIRFSTIHAFKGLESSAIIITDVEDYHDEKLIYTGLSRARFYLHILETESAASERAGLFFKRRLLNG